MAKKTYLIFQDGQIMHNVKSAKGLFGRLLGLMFKLKPKDDFFLVFKNAFWIHSFFCFFWFSSIFLDKDYKIIDYKLKNINDVEYKKQIEKYKEYLANKTNKKIYTYLFSIVDGTLEKIDWFYNSHFILYWIFFW